MEKRMIETTVIDKNGKKTIRVEPKRRIVRLDKAVRLNDPALLW